MLVLLAVVWAAIAIEQRGFDPSDVCDPGETSECLSTATGVIASEDIFFEDVRVAYADGTKTVDVLLKDDEKPGQGTRVVLEWWDGDVVALVERNGGRRYRTTDWPDPWWEWLAIWGVTAAAAGVVLVALFGIVAGLERLLGRRQAASSNGKPWRSRRRSKSRR